jgi:hypothetical protein
VERRPKSEDLDHLLGRTKKFKQVKNLFGIWPKWCAGHPTAKGHNEDREKVAVMPVLSRK